jgi:hypothetical protein
LAPSFPILFKLSYFKILSQLLCVYLKGSIKESIYRAAPKSITIVIKSPYKVTKGTPISQEPHQNKPYSYLSIVFSGQSHFPLVGPNLFPAQILHSNFLLHFLHEISHF